MAFQGTNFTHYILFSPDDYPFLKKTVRLDVRWDGQRELWEATNPFLDIRMFVTSVEAIPDAFIEKLDYIIEILMGIPDEELNEHYQALKRSLRSHVDIQAFHEWIYDLDEF